MSHEVIRSTIVPIIYLLSTVLFIFGIKRLSKVKTARQGNTLAAVGMLLAIVGALLELDYRWIAGGMILGAIIGATFAIRVQMTSMPEMVALFNGFGGIASALVATSVYWDLVVEKSGVGTVAEIVGTDEAVTVMLSILIGGITFTGSIIALMKLQGSLKRGQPRDSQTLKLPICISRAGRSQTESSTGLDHRWRQTPVSAACHPSYADLITRASACLAAVTG